ncbi:IS110 family transposase [Roseitalea porphyridii]|uniref:IS110 family transposase n=1 Tax=Roseitalea porphyridii TaxID=1852022 RepID=UPI0032EB6966
MTMFIALDVSLEKTAICIMSADGSIAAEVTAASEPEAIAAEFVRHGAAGPDALVGLEAGPLSEWIARGLADLGASVTLMETRQIRAALSSMVVKSDRNDARGMAHLLRMGWFRPVHLKSMDAREQRALLSARTTLARRLKDIENSVRGLLRGFGLKLGAVGRRRWEDRVRDVVSGHPTLSAILEPLVAARTALLEQLGRLDERLLAVAREDPVCRLLMTAPGVGAVVALTFRAAVDDPARFRSSKAIGPCFGLTPRRYQSGETDRSLGISKAGDAAVRQALFTAAHVIMNSIRRGFALKNWAHTVAARAGVKRAKVALARRLGVILHRMWVDGTVFRYA